LPVTLTAEGLADPVFSVLGGEFRALQWHGDTFDIPPGAKRLCRSSAYENQAFRVGSAFALQFHLEVTREMFEEWKRVPAYVASLQATLGDGGFELLSQAFCGAREDMADSARRLFERFLATTASNFLERTC